MNFPNHIAIVTGGGSGIGRATSQQLAREGARVVVVDIDREAGREAVAQIERDGGTAIYLYADVSQSADVQGVVNHVVEKWGRIEVLINNAGIMRFQSVVDLPEDDWDRVMSVNLRAAFLFSKYALPHFRHEDGRKGGSVVNVSSVHAPGHHAQRRGLRRQQRRIRGVHACLIYRGRAASCARQRRRARRG